MKLSSAAMEEPGTAGESATRETRPARVALLLSILTAVATLPALFGGFIWDDTTLIVRNAWLAPPIDWGRLLTTPFWETSGFRAHEGFGAYMGLHRPFMKAAFGIQRTLFGLDPLGFHLAPWLVHAANAALAFLWVRSRLEKQDPALRTAAAAGATLLVFALHPARAESVGWISGSTDVWMTFWALIALLLVERPGAGRIGLASAAAALAAWSKEPVWMLPLVPALDALAHPPGERRWGPTLGVASGILVAAAASTPILLGAADTPAWVTVDVGPLAARSAASLGAYVVRLFDPWPVAVRPFPFVVEGGRVVYPLALVAVGAAAALALLIAFGWALRRAPRRRVAAELALFVVPLVPALNLLPRNFDTIAADRFLYLPSVGAAALLARGLYRLASRGRASRRALALVMGVALIAVTLTTATAFARFHDDVTLRTHELEVHPEDVRNRLTLATFEFEAHRAAEARHLALEGIAAGHGHMSPPDELDLVALLAQTELALCSDADRTTLEALRDYFEAILAGTRVRLELSTVRYDRPFDRMADYWRGFHEDEMAAGAGTAALRLGALDEAVARLAPIAAEAGAGPCIAWVHALARRGEFEQALQAVATCRAHYGEGDPFDGVATRVREARTLATRAALTPRARAVRDASVALLLAAPQAAREALAPALAENPADPDLVQLRLRADVADGRLDLAEQVILEARAAAEDPGPYDALLQRLRRERSAPAPHTPR